MAGPSPMHEAGPPCPTCGYLADPAAGVLNFCPKCGQDLRPDAAADAASASLLGLVVADRYKLVAHLGEGGMGSVYKAEHVRMGKALAVKVLRGAFASDPTAVERFRAEARIVSRLSHPNTIAVFDFGEIAASGGFYLAMEYVPGRDLAHVLRDEGRLAEARVADIGQQILGSLAEAHEAGIVHRDMKPGNVMLTHARPGEDFVKVLDFGIAKLRDDTATGQTSVGAIVGTPNYLAPEQARGEPLDARADLYAVGCLLYELLAGHAPFAGRSPAAVVNAHLHEPPPPLGAGVPDASRRLVEIVHRALAKRRDERFASADEMREALLSVGEPTRSRPIVRPPVRGELEIASREDFREFERTYREFRRSRTAPFTLAALLLAAGAVVWRWPDVYGFLSARAPALAARLPGALVPGAPFDGEEREPDDDPSHAVLLPLPPGPAGEPAGGAVSVRGTIGARLDDRTGDVDVYRIDLPALPGPRVLSARWHAEGSEGGIRGLDVILVLHRAPAAGTAHASAPLVAASDRGGAGTAEALEAPVSAGTWYLSVRERHDEAQGPIEKPTDRYVLDVRLREVRPGEEVEPNDAPDTAGQAGARYAQWLAMARRNPLAEALPIRGELLPGDADTFALEAQGPSAVVVVTPAPQLAPALERWTPTAAELEAGAPERVRLDPAGEAEAGEPLVVVVPLAGAGSTLVRIVGGDTHGAYAVLSLGGSAGSAARAIEAMRSLAAAGKLPAALELAAAMLHAFPQSSARADVAAAAAQLAVEAAPGLRPGELSRFERGARTLGMPIFEEEGGSVRYRGAFEAPR